MSVAQPYRKKLIEVALPLDAINKEALHRKQKAPKGFPTSFHKWWSRKPLSACCAVIFTSLIDDPSAWPELFPTVQEQEKERKRIFAIIEKLVKWENYRNAEILYNAQKEIARSISRSRDEPMPEGVEAVQEYLTKHAPPVLDPFCGSGSISLEAQRLGLKTIASDLNPVAVFITKGLIEIPTKFARKAPMNPVSRSKTTLSGDWEGVRGLAEDVRYYGQWMHDEAEKLIGYLYPKVKITEEMIEEHPYLKSYIGKDLLIIALLWARTVTSPNPAVNGAHVPLVQSFLLSTKKGKEAWIEPVIDHDKNEYQFRVRVKGVDSNPPIAGTVGKKIHGGRCLLSGVPIPFPYIREEGKKGRMGSKLMAIVAEGERGRVFLSPNSINIENAKYVKPTWQPDVELPKKHRDFKPPIYGIENVGDLFTSRQLVSLATFTDLVQKARDKVLVDAKSAGILPNDTRRLNEGGNGPIAYADAITTYLACIIDRMIYFSSTLTTWLPKDNALRDCMPRQAMAMTWNFAEANPLGKSSGDIITCTNSISNYLDLASPHSDAEVYQLDARFLQLEESKFLVSTDPPYYDNINYAELSDFFYVWLRRSLSPIYPSLFSTVLTPKKQELNASPYRHGGNIEAANAFFEEGLAVAFSKIRNLENPAFPITIYYAFRQSEESEEDGENFEQSVSIVSTGWETFLEAVVHAGLRVTGTWPLRTEGAGRLHAKNTNALASSIVLVCHPRNIDAPLATRREFITALKQELPLALHTLQKSNIAPVDLAQASIGPGMEVFTRYARVLESDGSTMTIHTALGLINQELDEVLTEQEGEFDTDTRWALSWYEQYGNNEGPFGDAETLSKAKNTAVNGLIEAGIIATRSGKVKILTRNELKEDWDPTTDRRPTIWEATHYLIKNLENHGEQGAADLLKKLGGGMGEAARDLAYRLYIICERKKWTQEALGYNSLIVAWPEITKLVQSSRRTEKAQRMLLGEE